MAGSGQKKEPTGLKGMLRISVEGRWAGDTEKIISLRAIADSLNHDGAERPCCEWERAGMAGNYLGGGNGDTRRAFQHVLDGLASGVPARGVGRGDTGPQGSFLLTVRG